MRSLGAHGKFVALAVAVLVLGTGAAVLTGCRLVGDRNHEKVVEVYDRIVLGKTRTDQLGGLGIDVHDALVVPPAPHGMMGPAAQSCLATGRPCQVYFFHSTGGDIALLVLDGRVIDKVFIAQT